MLILKSGDHEYGEESEGRNRQRRTIGLLSFESFHIVIPHPFDFSSFEVFGPQGELKSRQHFCGLEIANTPVL